jgi:hypothetical protein
MYKKTLMTRVIMTFTSLLSQALDDLQVVDLDIFYSIHHCNTINDFNKSKS